MEKMNYAVWSVYSNACDDEVDINLDAQFNDLHSAQIYRDHLWEKNCNHSYVILPIGYELKARKCNTK